MELISSKQCPIICGHEFNRRFLDKQVKNLTAQSFVFLGPEKVGRRLIALDFAQKLMCLDLKNGQACGQCSSCLSLIKKLNPDLFEVHFVESAGESEEISEEVEEEETETDKAVVAKKSRLKPRILR